MKNGDMFLTKGGWIAIWGPGSVFHQINGGRLYSHNDDGTVRSESVGVEYDLEYRLVRL